MVGGSGAISGPIGCLSGPRRGRGRVVFLDEESRDLGWVPAPGFVEDDLVAFAQAAGVAYRSYALTLGKFSSLRVSPSALCETLFTRSARRVRLVGDQFESVEGWYSERR